MSKSDFCNFAHRKSAETKINSLFWNGNIGRHNKYNHLWH